MPIQLSDQFYCHSYKLKATLNGEHKPTQTKTLESSQSPSREAIATHCDTAPVSRHVQVGIGDSEVTKQLLCVELE